MNPAIRCNALSPSSRLPGHWLLARVGKRVLRPGGVEMTRKMLASLQIDCADRVVEFAPGLGDTAGRLSRCAPFSYIGVDRDNDAIRRLQARFRADDWMHFVQAAAEQTHLPGGSATVVIAEAMLSMQSAAEKQKIITEAARLLAPRGRYAIHELCLVETSRKAELERDLSLQIHSGIRLLTAPEWQLMLEQAGFRVRTEFYAPMHLLHPARILRDEGWARTLRIACNLLCDRDARARVLSMRRAFEEHAGEIAAICLIATKGK